MAAIGQALRLKLGMMQPRLISGTLLIDRHLPSKEERTIKVIFSRPAANYNASRTEVLCLAFMSENFLDCENRDSQDHLEQNETLNLEKSQLSLGKVLLSQTTFAEILSESSTVRAVITALSL